MIKIVNKIITNLPSFLKDTVEYANLHNLLDLYYTNFIEGVEQHNPFNNDITAQRYTIGLVSVVYDISYNDLHAFTIGYEELYKFVLQNMIQIELQEYVTETIQIPKYTAEVDYDYIIRLYKMYKVLIQTSSFKGTLIYNNIIKLYVQKYSTTTFKSNAKYNNILCCNVQNINEYSCYKYTIIPSTTVGTIDALNISNTFGKVTLYTTVNAATNSTTANLLATDYNTYIVIDKSIDSFIATNSTLQINGVCNTSNVQFKFILQQTANNSVCLFKYSNVPNIASFKYGLYNNCKGNFAISKGTFVNAFTTDYAKLTTTTAAKLLSTDGILLCRVGAYGTYSSMYKILYNNTPAKVVDLVTNAETVQDSTFFNNYKILNNYYIPFAQNIEYTNVNSGYVYDVTKDVLINGDVALVPSHNLYSCGYYISGNYLDYVGKGITNKNYCINTSS